MIQAGTADAAPANGYRRHGALLILATAAVLMLPELWFGISWSDSLPYNVVWTEQFRESVRSGDLYPRWLPDSWGGLGSPTFYVYPPLYFWVASIVDLLTFRLLPVEKLVPVTSLIFLACSGLAMRIWLSGQAKGWAPLLGAMAYMAGPYHLNDIYVRGALAEAASYALIPLILIGLRRQAQGRQRAIALTALSYAALVLTHLPTAVIVSLFLLPYYVIFRAVRMETGGVLLIVNAAIAAVLGLGLAAFYLLPALQLSPFISYDALFATFYQPENWLIWFPDKWPRTYPVAWTILICAAAAPLLLHAGLRARREGRVEVLFWCAIAMIGIIMALGLVPPLWELHPVDRVQFPWRFLVIVEFAVITALAAVAPRLRNPLVFAGTVFWSAAMGGIVFVMALVTSPEGGEKAAHLQEIRMDNRDAPEYLPPAMPIAFGDEFGLPERSAVDLPGVAAVELTPPQGTAIERRYADGGALVTVDTRASATITLRRFEFPHWRLTDAAGKAVPIEGTEAGLLRWRVPAGRSVYILRHGRAPGETLGLILSALSLALLLILAFLLDRRSQMRHSVS